MSSDYYKTVSKQTVWDVCCGIYPHEHASYQVRMERDITNQPDTTFNYGMALFLVNNVRAIRSLETLCSILAQAYTQKVRSVHIK